MAYKIVTDSACDLNLDFYRKSDLISVPMDVSVDGQFRTIMNDDKKGLDEYYEAMLNDANVSSTSVNVQRFEEYFTKVLDEGFDIFYTGLTKGLSATYKNACMARDNLKDRYPDRKIVVVESTQASTGEGVLLQVLYTLKEAGMSLEEMEEWTREYGPKVATTFSVDDLKYLYKGGRVTKAQAGVGNFLNVKPMLYIDEEGTLKIEKIARGTKNANKFMLNKFESYWDPSISDMVLVGYVYNDKNAKTLYEYLKENYPQANLYMAPIGTLIGTHVGPGMYSIGFFANHR